MKYLIYVATLFCMFASMGSLTLLLMGLDMDITWEIFVGFLGLLLFVPLTFFTVENIDEFL